MKMNRHLKRTIFMRVLFCKIHCPFMCFCKPSAAHLYTSGPLKLEKAPSTACTVSAVCNNSSPEVKEGVAYGIAQHETNTAPKSCMRKLPCQVEKKRVQWNDEFGKELAQIKEFESSDTEDNGNEDESSRCLCIIL